MSLSALAWSSVDWTPPWTIETVCWVNSVEAGERMALDVATEPPVVVEDEVVVEPEMEFDIELDPDPEPDEVVRFW